MNNRVQLILLPGMGADERLFAPQRAALPQMIVPRWIAPEDGETLPQYAARMAQTVPVEPPMVLGGCSLGGMVAYEMARYLSPAAVVLIGSCRTRQGVRGLFRSLHALAERLPVRAFDAAKPLAPIALATVMRLTPPQKMLCAAMFKEADSRFMKWALSAILSWEPQPVEGPPVFHIHGAKDLLIPARDVVADELVPDGGHLVNLTHSEEVNAFVRRVLMTVVQ